MLIKKRIIKISALLMAFLTFLTGCSFSIVSVENLVRPPYASNELKYVQKAFYDFVDSSVSLLIPSTGDHRTSFITYDIDGEKGDEVLVIYLGSDSTAHLHILKQSGDEWINAGDFTGYGNAVDFVKFVDMNNDAISEILIGWSRKDSATVGKYFSVFSCDTLSKTFKIRSLISESYTLMTTFDVDGDKNTDILITKLDTSQTITKAYARLFSYQENFVDNQSGITPVNEIALDGNITSYYHMYTESTDEENIVYIDAYKGDAQMITEVLVCKKPTKDSDDSSVVTKNALEAPLLDKTTLTMNATWRGYNIPARDIDGDGRIEIPVQNLPEDSNQTENTGETDLTFTDWVRYTNGELVTVKSSLVSPKGAYYIFINDDIKTQIKAKYSFIDKVLKIYTENSYSQTELVSVYEFAASDWNIMENPSEKGYLFLRENQSLNTVYAYSFTRAGQDDFGFSAEYVDKNFIINS